MKRSTVLAGLLVLAAASPAAGQSAPPTGQPVNIVQACPSDAYTIVRAPDGSSVSILFNDFSAQTQRGQRGTVRTTCRIETALALPAGYSAGLTSVDYRGFALLGARQSATITADYEVGRGNGGRFNRRIQGRHDRDFYFVDRLPPGRLRPAGCLGAPAPVLAINMTLGLSTSEQGAAAMIALDSADQTAAPTALTYRFDVRPCATRERLTEVDVLS